MSGATTPSESDGTMGSDDDDIDNWLEKHMPPWLIEALRSWPERWPDDAKYQSEKAARKKVKEELKEKLISSEDYVGSLREPEALGFHAASVVITNRGRALMLFERRGTRTRCQVALTFPGGKRDRMEETAWECARREAEEETGCQAQLPTTPPSHVAWCIRKTPRWYCTSLQRPMPSSQSASGNWVGHQRAMRMRFHPKGFYLQYGCHSDYWSQRASTSI